MANGWGGKREGAGRKPLPITLAKNALIANKIATAEAAFAFQEAILHDETQPLMNRQAAAIWIYEQIMGKAPLHMTVGQGDLADWRARALAEQGEEAGKLYIDDVLRRAALSPELEREIGEAAK